MTASLGEAILNLLQPPWLDAGVWALRTLLLLVPLTLVAIAMVVLFPLRSRLGVTGSHVRVGGVTLISLLMVGWGSALWLTQFESSVALRSLRGLALLSLFGGAATALALLAAAAARRSSTLARVGPLRLGAIAFTLLAVACFGVSRNVELAPFWPLRLANLFLEAALALAAAALLRRIQLIGGRTVVAAVLVLAAAAGVAMWLPPERAHRAYARILLDGGSERRVLLGLRRTFDRDGNGFSAWFDGGDCDDRDARARPLGLIDCDHILRQGERPSPPPALGGVPVVSRVLVITIDAWRCELRGQELCPRLRRLAASASYAGQQRPFMAATLRSLGALFGGPYTLEDRGAAERPAYTLAQARARGYRSKAFFTLRSLGLPAVGGSFDEQDDSLVSQQGLESVVSGALSRRVLADLAVRAGDRGKRLVWAHFLDPHAAYVPTDEGQPVPTFLFDRRGAYSAEVRRVEARVAELIEQARRLGYDRDAAIVVTSDHGESFSHGRLYHSLSSYDGEMKIPLFVWVFDATGRLVNVPLAPRSSERDVAALLAHLVGAPPPPGQSALSITDPLDGDQQFVLVEDGWKIIYHLQGHFDELYDLGSDPSEEHDLSQREPARLAHLRRRLGAELTPLFPGGPGD